jgi:hypothetical protein
MKPLRSACKKLPSLLLIALLAGAGACTSKPAGKFRPISAQEAQGLLRNDFALLIDARESPGPETPTAAPQRIRTIAASRILGASDANDASLQNLPTTQTLVILADSTESAEKAAVKLAGFGFQSGSLGTLEDWKKAGGRVESGSSPQR